MAKLSKKQSAFAKEYIKDLNGTQAAIRAGYSHKTAEAAASRLLRNVNVQQKVSEAIQKRNERTEIDADYVLKRLIEIDQMDAADILNEDGSLKHVKDWPKSWRQLISGLDVMERKSVDDGTVLASVIKKIKWPDKLKNLELIGKHVDVQAWNDKAEVNVNVKVENITDEELERIARGGN